MTATQYVMMDTETGGTDSSKVSLLTASFQIVDLTELRKSVLSPSKRTLDLWLKPDDGHYVIRAEGLAVNKIDLVGHDTIADTYKIGRWKLIQFLSTHADVVETTRDGSVQKKINKYVALGWNVEYDINMIKNNLLTKEEFDNYFGYSSFDVKTLAMQNKALGLLPEDLWLSLPSVAEHFGIDTSNSHNAIEDCKITLRVLECLVNQLSNNN